MSIKIHPEIGYLLFSFNHHKKITIIHKVLFPSLAECGRFSNFLLPYSSHLTPYQHSLIISRCNCRRSHHIKKSATLNSLAYHIYITSYCINKQIKPSEYRTFLQNAGTVPCIFVHTTMESNYIIIFAYFFHHIRVFGKNHIHHLFFTPPNIKGKRNAFPLSSHSIVKCIMTFLSFLRQVGVPKLLQPLSQVNFH